MHLKFTFSILRVSFSAPFLSRGSKCSPLVTATTNVFDPTSITPDLQPDAHIFSLSMQSIHHRLEECGGWQSQPFSLSVFTFSTRSCTQVIEELCTRNADDSFMLQLVTAKEPRQKRSRSSTIIPAQAHWRRALLLLAFLYVSPEQRHPRAIGHYI